MDVRASSQARVSGRAIPASVNDNRIKGAGELCRQAREIDGSLIALNAGGRVRYRSEDRIGRRSSASVGIVLVCEGGGLFVQGDHSRRLRRGDVLIGRNDLATEFVVDEWCTTFVLLVPSERFDAVVRLPLPSLPHVLSDDGPLGVMVSNFIRSLSDNVDVLDDSAAEAAVHMVLGVVGTALNAAATPEARSGRETLYDRLLAYVDRHLEDPDLTPSAIAGAHRISLRYLYLLFSERGWTVAGWIRERRLLHCRGELTGVSSGRSLTEIAYAWGFSDSAHFSRSFRKRFGMPPKAWRDRFRATANG